ncbi:MAG TPA: glycosyltransferase family 2 protein [Tepidisphaeraceae bacterium]|jgi:GT2 family glycosyltransferase
MYKLSILLPTCQRGPLLKAAIESVAAHTKCNYELIVIDGASTDNTAAVLDGASVRLGNRLKVIRETKRRGFVRALNAGFAAATGEFVCWLNDDARPRHGALDKAAALMERAPADVGMLAMFHHWNSNKNIAFQCERDGTTYSVCHVRGTLYANFPIGRRKVFEQLGFLDEQFVFCAADPDLSLKAWNTGLRVEPAWGVCIDHDEHADDRRAEDSPQMQADNARLFAKWDLPPRNPLANDFDPSRPCTLRGSRSAGSLAA